MFTYEGDLVVEHFRVYEAGTYVGCYLFETIEAVFYVDYGELDVRPYEGRTRRSNHISQPVACAEAYDERYMTPEELSGLDYADGRYFYDGDQLVTTTVRADGSSTEEWRWERE